MRLLEYQRRWVEDRSALKMVVKARQIGYSFAATLQALLRCLERKTTWIFLSKGERQSKLLMEKVKEHIQSCGIVAQAFESTFFEGASRKQLEVRLPERLGDLRPAVESRHGAGLLGQRDARRVRLPRRRGEDLLGAVSHHYARL